MLPVGRKPVVQYVVEELAPSGIRRLLFVTGPGKTSIENHFDLNAELIAFLRETGKEELLEELDFERQDLRVLLHAAAAAARPGPRGAVRPAARRRPAVRRGAGRLDHRPATPSRDIVRRMIEEFEREAGRRRDRLRGGAARGRRALRHRRSRAGDGAATSSSWTTSSRSRASAEAPSTLAVAARYVFAPGDLRRCWRRRRPARAARSS